MIIQNSLGLSEDSIVVPRGRKGLAALKIPLKDIHDVEARIPEIQRATPITLPELVTVFTVGILKMSQILPVVELELREAKRAMEAARAIALLERAEGVLKEKQIKSSADTREAAITMDTDVQEAQNRYDALNAIQAFLQGKNNAFEMAYHGAKKICDLYVKSPSTPNYGGDEHSLRSRG